MSDLSKKTARAAARSLRTCTTGPLPSLRRRRSSGTSSNLIRTKEEKEKGTSQRSPRRSQRTRTGSQRHKKKQLLSYLANRVFFFSRSFFILVQKYTGISHELPFSHFTCFARRALPCCSRPPPPSFSCPCHPPPPLHRMWPRPRSSWPRSLRPRSPP